MPENDFSILSGHRIKPGFQALLLNPETHALTLLVIARDAYPEADDEGHLAFLKWAPETLWRELEEDFTVQLPLQNCHKLAAAVCLMNGNEFFKITDTFIRLCNILSGDVADPDGFDPADCLEIAWGITEACLIHPPDEEEPFSDQIRHYIGHMLDEEGIQNAPGLLRLGIRNPNKQGFDSTIVDDPLVFKDVWEKQALRAQEIERAVEQELAELVVELSGLKLAHGDTTDIVGKLRTAMQR